jgi:cyclase
MTKKRVIAVIIVKDGWTVQSIGFGRYRPVGRPEIAARFFSSWGADEIIMLDIEASRQRRVIDTALIERIASQVHVPLTAGGGIRSVDDVRRIVQAGADKVTMNLAAFEDFAAIRNAARAFGNQCIIGVMDARRGLAGGHEVYVESGSKGTGLGAREYALRLAEFGVGEILIQSIDNDGMGCGYDLDLIDAVGGAVGCPVIALGGAGHPEHLRAALSRPHVSAAGAANFFHYTEHAIASAKAYLRVHGIDVRLDNRADYRLHQFSATDGRIMKRSDDALAEEVYEFLPEEVI